jgi:hypothetical protein
MRRVGAFLFLAFLAPQAAFADSLPLPKPTGEIPVVASAFPDRPERLRTSIVPGRVDDTERIHVALGPSGAPAAVTMTQRLVLHGTGQFIVWERSSAQDVEALEDTVAPVLKREAVIWQGFVSGRKELVARLTLDPVIEAELLPFGVTLEWSGAGAVGPGGALPGPGELTVRVTNRTTRAMTVPTGTVAARDLVGPLDALLRHATARRPGAPPMAGRGLPASLPASATGSRELNTTAPFRVTGTIRVPGGAPVTPESGGVRHLADGLELDGVLSGEAAFTVSAAGAATVELDLTAYPTLDPRLLQPPRGRTWADWLRLGPTPAETAAALTTLVEAAAAAARTDEYAPYLGHHGPGTVRTTYRITLAPPAAVVAPPAPLRPKPLPIALASIALVAILANTTAIWRRL